MRWKLGSVVLAALLFAFAMSTPASGTHTCRHVCLTNYMSCYNGCAGNPDCQIDCHDYYEIQCLCHGCNYCP